MPIYVNVTDYHELYRKTRLMRPEIRRMFQRRLRKAADIGANAARRKAAEWPVHSRFHSGLRGELVAGIGTAAGYGHIRITQKDLYRKGWRNPPADIDSGSWRHPVFGGDRWVTQLGTHYFFKEIADKHQEMLAEIEPILEDIAEFVKNRPHVFGGHG